MASETKFLADAQIKFGMRFDYSQVEYVRQKVPIVILCPDHGAFSQTPDKHLQSKFGCPKCGVNSRAEQRLTDGSQRFMASFKRRFLGKLELLTPYISVKDSIEVRCMVHNHRFQTTPDMLNLGTHGCPLCGRKATGQALRGTQEDFLSKVAAQFGDQFDLSRVSYKTRNDHIEVGCPIHGWFQTTPANFISSTHGCSKCGRMHAGYAADRIKRLEAGEAKQRPTRLAVMKVEVFGISAFKVGITTRRLVDRYAFALREVLYEVRLDELNALKLEQQIHAKYFRLRDVRVFLAGLRQGSRWGGDSELYKEQAIPLVLEDIKAAVEAIERSSVDYWQSQSKLEAPILRIQHVVKQAGVFNKAKAVVCLDDGVVFTSATSAANAVGSTQALVSMVCNGKRGQTKGHRFAYVEDQESGGVAEFTNMNKGANHKWARAVRCIDTGAVYKTLTEAALDTGVDSSKITSVCRGHRKSTGGLRWEYVET